MAVWGVRLGKYNVPFYRTTILWKWTSI